VCLRPAEGCQKVDSLWADWLPEFATQGEQLAALVAFEAGLPVGWTVAIGAVPAEHSARLNSGLCFVRVTFRRSEPP